MCQLHWLLLVDFGSELCVYVFERLLSRVSVTPAFASRLRQWVVCFSSLCPMCQLHRLLLVNFGSGLCVLAVFVPCVSTLVVDFGSGLCVLCV